MNQISTCIAVRNCFIHIVMYLKNVYSGYGFSCNMEIEIKVEAHFEQSQNKRHEYNRKYCML